jgi:hypothetical protein
MKRRPALQIAWSASARRVGLPSQGLGQALVLTNLGGGVYPDGGYDPLQTNYNPALELARCCVFRTLMSYSGRPAAEGGTIPRPDLAVRVPTVSATDVIGRTPASSNACVSATGCPPE